jgi:glutathione peroxidase
LAQRRLQRNQPSSPRRALNNLYAELTSAVPGAEGDKAAFRDNLKGYGMTPTEDPEVLWNFEKFLVSRDGEVIGRFAPSITPDDQRITSAIER